MIARRLEEVPVFRALIPLLLVVLFLPTATLAQDEARRPAPRAQPDATSNGPGSGRTTRVVGRIEVGEHAEDFELETSAGAHMRLSSLKGDWVLLVFARRRHDATALTDMSRQLDSIGVRTLVVCTDKAHALRGFAGDRDWALTLLADPLGEIASLYGLFDPVTRSTSPAVVLIDRRGRVRMAFLGQPPPDELAGLVQSAALER